MTAENKTVETADYKQSYSEFYVKNKIGLSSNANEKFLAEFYIELTFAMYFQMLCEQEP